MAMMLAGVARGRTSASGVGSPNGIVLGSGRRMLAGSVARAGDAGDVSSVTVTRKRPIGDPPLATHMHGDTGRPVAIRNGGLHGARVGGLRMGRRIG